MLLRAGLLLAVLSSSSLAQDNGTEPAAGGGQADGLGAKSHGEAGDTTWSVRLGFYNRDDSGAGNPFLDESLTIIEPVFIYDHQVSEDYGYDIKFSYDKVSSASIDRLSEFDGQSGASGDDYFSLDAAFRHKLSEFDNFSWHLGVASEYDYASVGLGAGWTRNFEDRDASLSFNLNGYFDVVSPIRFDGSEDADESRTSLAGTVSWYQIINPTLHGELGLTYSAQTGFLETAYNAVVAEIPGSPANPLLENNANGIEFAEVLPDSRNRLSVFGRLRQQLGPHDAVEVGTRFYDDDWGIGAYDITPRYLHEFESGLLLDLRYRFYSQSAADAYGEHFTTAPAAGEERTQDSDLGEFDSSLLGAHIKWGDPSEAWDFGVNYLDRSDGLDHIFFNIGWSTSY
ncbi:MAG: hypothetical protein ACJAZ8_002157 [Planctomycetota bacterium]|jgi:hypothetical protein